jgi:hypothetical protein
MAEPASDLSDGDPGVEPERRGSVPEVVGPSRQR